MYPFYFLLPVILLFIEYFSNSAEVRDAVTKLFPRILRIISVASGMWRVLVLQNHISLAEGEKYFFSLWYVIGIFPCLLSNYSAGVRLAVVGAGFRLELVSRSFLFFPPAHLIVFDGVQVLVEPLIGNHMMSVFLDIKFVLHGLIQFISDWFSDELLGYNFIVLVPVGLEGWLYMHCGHLGVFIVLKQGHHSLIVLDYLLLVHILDVLL